MQFASRCAIAYVAWLGIPPFGNANLAAQDAEKNQSHGVDVISAKQKYYYKASWSTIPRKVIFTPDGKWFCAPDRKEFVVWDTATGKEKNRFEVSATLEMSFYRFAAAPDNKHLLFQYSSSIKYFELASGREVATLALPTLNIKSAPVMSILPMNQFLLFDDGILQVRDADTGKVVRNTGILRKDVPGYRLFQMSGDQKWLMAEQAENTALTVREVASGKEVAALKGHGSKIQAARFSPSGKRVASTGDDKTVRIWNTQTGEMLHKIALPDEGLQVEFSPNEKWLAVGMGGNKCRILLLDATTGRELSTWQGFPDAAKALTFNPQGNLLAASGGRYIQIWELSAAVR